MATIPDVSDFPKTLANYLNHFSYTTQEEMQDIVTTIAKKTSHLYARLLTAEGHEERNEKLMFLDHPSSFPSTDRVNHFETSLADKITKDLLENSSAQTTKKNRISLATRYTPDEYLKEVLTECQIDALGHPELHKYFPCKTRTTIQINFELKTLYIEIQPESHLDLVKRQILEI